MLKSMTENVIPLKSVTKNNMKLKIYTCESFETLPTKYLSWFFLKKLYSNLCQISSAR